MLLKQKDRGEIQQIEQPIAQIDLLTLPLKRHATRAFF